MSTDLWTKAVGDACLREVQVEGFEEADRVAVRFGQTGGRQVDTASDGSVQHESAVVTDWSRADGIGSARTVETRRDVFIAWFTTPLAVANTLSVGSEIALDYE